MKDELINKITALLDECGIDIYEAKQKLYLIFCDYEIHKVSRQLSLRTPELNNKIIKKFILFKAVAGRSKQTLNQYAKEIEKILSRINKSYCDVTADDIRVYLAFRQTQDGISKVTAQNELRYLKSFYKWCTSEELITKNPCDRIESIKQDKKKKPALTDIEVERIREACANSKEKAIVETLLSTGCRVSEMCNIKLSSINGDSISVIGKGGKERIVYLNAKAKIAIDKYLNERVDNSPYLFPKCRGKNTNQACDKESIERIMRKIALRAGIEKANPHKLRRTCATSALKRGMTIEQVSRMLGHEQLTTTQIYLDLSDDDLQYAHNKFVV